MKRVLWAMASLSLATCLSYAAAIPNNSIYGDYVEARTADVYTGPCFANSEVGLTGQLAVMGWKVTKGSWSGTDLEAWELWAWYGLLRRLAMYTTQLTQLRRF